MTEIRKPQTKTESPSDAQPTGTAAEAIESASRAKPAAGKKPRTVDWHWDKDPVTHRKLWLPGPAKKPAKEPPQATASSA